MEMKAYFIQGLLPCYKDLLKLDLELNMKNLLTKAICLDSLNYNSTSSEPTTSISTKVTTQPTTIVITSSETEAIKKEIKKLKEMLFLQS